MNPSEYCHRLHAGLVIKLDTNSSEVVVDPCTINPYMIQLGTVSDAFNHPALLNMRQQSQHTGKLYNMCAVCESREKQGLTNHHKSSGDRLTDHQIYDYTGPKFLTFQIDTTCNLACVTCGPALSTKWRTEEKSVGYAMSAGKSSADLNKNPVRLPADVTRDIIRNLDLTNLQYVHIYGGEPFLSSLHEVILQELLPQAHNIILEYDTNGTQRVAADILQLWQQYKTVRIKFSLDGTERVFEYLRWPASWSGVTENIEWFRQNMPGQHEFSLRPAIGFLNMHTINDLRQWYKTHFLKNRHGVFNQIEYNAVYGLYTSRNMTLPMITDAKQLYKKDPRMMRLIPDTVSDTIEEKIMKIQANLSDLDARRGLDWHHYLPHLKKYLQKKHL